MKHKIKYIIEKDTAAEVEKFCESVGFDNVIGIYPFGSGEDVFAMIHYKSEN